MSVIFVDTETTGLDPDIHDLWEIALIEEDGTEHEWRMKPRGHPDPTAMRVNRMYERIEAWNKAHPDMFSDPFWPLIHPERIAWEVAHLTSNKHLVGIVPDFDARFLDTFLRRHGYVGAWHYQTVDAEVLAAGRLMLPPPWKHNDVGKALGVPDIPAEEAHTAIVDARYAREFYYMALSA